MLHAPSFLSRLPRVLLLLLLSTLTARAQNQNLVFNPAMVSLFAGGGTDAGNNGAAFVGPATGPHGVTFDATQFALAVDGDGNVYIARRADKFVQVIAGSARPIPALPLVPNPIPGTVYPLAGNTQLPSATPPTCSGSTDNAGDGCKAIEAPVGFALNGSTGVGIAVDSHGNVYLSDPVANLIRVVYGGGSVPNLPGGSVPGNIYRIAGTVLASGNSGDGGPALNALLNTPAGLRVDGNGNIYFGDQKNNNVRVIYAGGSVPNIIGGVAGNIYRIAGSANSADACTPHTSPCGDGGPATSAILASVADVTLDSGNNIYISDAGNFRVRAIYASGSLPGIGNPGPNAVGNVYTIAGTGMQNAGPDNVAAIASALNTLAGLASDAVGNIYIVDSGVGAGLRKVDRFGIISTLFRQQTLVVCSTQLTDPGADSLGIGDGCPANLAKLSPNSSAVAVDLAGNLLVGDGFETPTTIRKLGKLDTLASVLYPAGIVGAKGPPETVAVSNAGPTVVTLGSILVAPPFNLETGAPGDCDGSTALPSGGSCRIRISYSAQNRNRVTLSAVLSASGLTVALHGGERMPTPQNATTTALGISPAVVSETQPVTLTATVKTTFATSVAISGTVQFQQGTNLLGDPVPLVTQGPQGSVATLNTALPIGSYVGATGIVAVYSSDANYMASSSAPGALRVVSAATPIATVSLSPSSTTLSLGQNLTLTATLTPSAGPTGTVTFQDGTGTMATVPVNAGTATFSTTLLGPGTHRLTAFYGGDATYPPNVSTSKFVTVTTAQLMFMPGIISTIAGTPKVGGFAGDGGPSTQAQLNFPQASFVDAAGNVYIADSKNRRVRKISTDAQHTITTIAGNGNQCQNGTTCGDGGPSVAAALTAAPTGSLAGIWGDAYGNLFMADNDNFAVRKVNFNQPTPTIATVAGTIKQGGTTGDGGPATSAKLSTIAGIAGDQTGNLYIIAGPNQNDNRVRKVDGQSGFINTVAGGGSLDADGIPATSAKLQLPPPSTNSPAGLAVDSLGNIYVVESLRGRVRKVDAQTGMISTVAGGGASTAEGILATNYKLSSPVGIAVDQAGNLYIVDNGTSIRMVSTNGLITTIAGTAPGGFGGDGGPATNALLNKPQGLTLDLAGNLYITDTANNVVRQVTAGTTALNFGNQNVDTTSPPRREVAISTGSQPLTLTSAVVAAGFGQRQPAVTGDCSSGIALPPGSSCNFDIFFAPTDDLQYSASATIGDNSVNAVNGQNVITLTGTGTGTPPQQDQTINFPAPPNVTYGIPPVTLTATSTSGLPVTYTLISGPAMLAGSVLTIRGVGTVTVKASQPGNAAYKPAPEVIQSFTVAPAVLTVTASNASRAKGAENPPFAFTITGFQYTDTQLGVVTGQPVLATTATPASDPGTYPIVVTQGTLAAANYTFAFVNGVLTVTGLQSQTITFPPLADGTYGTLTTVALNATASSDLAVSYTVSTPLTASVSGSTLTIKQAGQVIVIANQAGSATYAPAPAVARSFSVLQAPLTVAADDKQRAQGQRNPLLTYTTTGLVNGDKLSGQPILTTTATQSSPQGTYPITITMGSLASPNYLFTFKNGTLTVLPPATVASQTTLTVSASGLNIGDSVTLTARVAGADGQAGPTGTVTFLDGSRELGTVTLSQGVATLSTDFMSQLGTHSVTASYGGDVTFNPSGSAVIAITVNPPAPDFTLTANPSEITIPSGSTRVVMITMTPIHSFRGAVGLSCGQLPPNISCVFTPTTLTATGQPAEAPIESTLTIFTSATSASLPPPTSFASRRGSASQRVAAVLGVCLCLTALILMSNRKGGRGKRTWKLAGLALASAGMVACGAGSSAPLPTAPAGTSSFTVTATAMTGNISHALNLKITVR